MKIALASDLHLEFGDINLINDQGAEVLILSGDIMTAQDLHDHPEPINTTVNLGRRQESAQRYRDFLKRCSEAFPHVVSSLMFILWRMIAVRSVILPLLVARYGPT